MRTIVVNGHKQNLALDGDGLVVACMGETNVELQFSPPALVDVDGRVRSLSRVSFLVRDPRAVTALLRAHVARPETRRLPRSRAIVSSATRQMLAPSAGGPSGSGAAKPTPSGAGGVVMPTV